MGSYVISIERKNNLYYTMDPDRIITKNNDLYRLKSYRPLSH
jgi:hypothetical protein